jgi:hypothetical protein
VGSEAKGDKPVSYNGLLCNWHLLIMVHTELDWQGITHQVTLPTETFFWSKTKCSTGQQNLLIPPHNEPHIDALSTQVPQVENDLVEKAPNISAVDMKPSTRTPMFGDSFRANEQVS